MTATGQHNAPPMGRGGRGAGSGGALRLKRFESGAVRQSLPVELHRDDHGSFFGAVDEDRRLAGEAGTRDHLAEDVARLGDLGPVLLWLITHVQSVTDALHAIPSFLSFPSHVDAYVSYDSHVKVNHAMPP